MSANDLFCNLNLDEYSHGVDEENNDYESNDSKDAVKPAPKVQIPPEQQDGSNSSQAEFAAHMGRQGGKSKEDTPAKAPADAPTKVPADDGEDAKKEFSDHLARQGAKKPAPVQEKAPAKDGASYADDGASKEAHDTVIMQTDHVAGKKPDDTVVMSADHVAAKKGEHAIVKITDQASEKSPGDGTVKIPAEEKARKVDDREAAKAAEKPAGGAMVKLPAEEKAENPKGVGNVKASIPDSEYSATTAAVTKENKEIPERDPGW